MNGEFDLTRDVAEKILKRAMTPVREVLDFARVNQSPDDEDMRISLGAIRELDRDLGVLGLTLATRYSERVEYQTALGVMSAENVRLHTTVELLTEMAEKYRAENVELIKGLARARNANDKIKESSMKGF